jgi:hypothetical protein
MNKRGGHYWISLLVFVCVFLGNKIYTKKIKDYCEDMFEIGLESKLGKYLKENLDKIAGGNEKERKEAISLLTKLVSKKRIGRCSRVFPENLRIFINDYIASLGEGPKSERAAKRIQEAVADKITCMLTRRELNRRIEWKIPLSVCGIPTCQLPLEHLAISFEGERRILLYQFLEIYWGAYYGKGVNKFIKQQIVKEWERKICGEMKGMAEKIAQQKEIDSRAVVNEEEYTDFVTNYIIGYFGNEVIRKGGKEAVIKILETASKETLPCSERGQLLDFLHTAFLKTSEVFTDTPDLKAKLVETFGKLTKARCYATPYALVDSLTALKLYSDKDIMDIFVNKILDNLKVVEKDSKLRELKFLKEYLASGFLSLSNEVYKIKNLRKVMKFFVDEFTAPSNASEYDYREQLVKMLYAFSNYKVSGFYKYLFKNSSILFNEFSNRQKILRIKGIPTYKYNSETVPYSSYNADSTNYLQTLFEIGAMYNLENFRNFVKANAKSLVGEFEDVRQEEIEKKYIILLLAWYIHSEDGFTKYLAEKIINGITADYHTKIFAFKNLLYTLPRDKVLNYTKQFSDCLAFLINAFLGEKSLLQKIDNIQNCDKLILNTDAVKELLKIAVDINWIKNVKNNKETCRNILNLNFSAAKEFVEYSTCAVTGHLPISTSIGHPRSALFGIECREQTMQTFEGKQGKGCSCNSTSFVSALVYLMLNNLKNPTFYKKLDDNTKQTRYAGTVEQILRRIALENNATLDIRALKKSKFKYIANTFSSFSLLESSQTNKSQQSYKVLLLKISERFFITYIFEKRKWGNVLKVLPFESAASWWTLYLHDLLSD